MNSSNWHDAENKIIISTFNQRLTALKSEFKVKMEITVLNTAEEQAKA